MANSFKRKLQANVGTSLTAVGGYTCPASNTVTIIGLVLTNITGNTIFADATLNNGTGDTYIIKGAPVPSGGALVVVGGDQKIVLEAGDSVKVKSDTATSLDAVMSILETTI